MPSKPQTARREHSDREVAVILALHAKGYTAREISCENLVPRSTINATIRRAASTLDGWYHRHTRSGRPNAGTARVTPGAPDQGERRRPTVIREGLLRASSNSPILRLELAD